MLAKNKKYWYGATVVRVVDGDSLILDIDLGFNVTIKNKGCRILGINTPEIRGKEKELGKIAKEALDSILSPNTKVVIRSLKPDSFGRFLADVYIEDTDLNIAEFLLEKGYAKPWDGTGTKPSFDLTEEYPKKS